MCWIAGQTRLSMSSVGLSRAWRIFEGMSARKMCACVLSEAFVTNNRAWKILVSRKSNRELGSGVQNRLLSCFPASSIAVEPARVERRPSMGLQTTAPESAFAVCAGRVSQREDWRRQERDDFWALGLVLAA